MDLDFIKHLEEIKDNESNVEIRLLDTKHCRLFYKTLTYKELINVMSGLEGIKWEDMPKKGDKK